MANFKKSEIGKIEEIEKNYENGKVFLHDILNLTSSEISITKMPKGTKLPFNHKHKQNEEIYIFLKGEGMFTIDGEKIEIKEGTLIKVLPEGIRTMEAKDDLEYICIQAKKDSLEQFGLGDGELC